MKKLLSIIFTVLFLLLIGIVIAAYLIPIEKLQEEGLKQVEAKTGLLVKIDGKVSLSLFPSIAIKTPKVTVDKKGEKKRLASIESLKLNLSLTDLLKKKVSISSLELIKPQIYYEVKRNGKSNWDIEAQKAEALQNDLLNKDQPSYEKTAADDALPMGLEIDSLEITDGALDYADYKSNQFKKLSNIDFDIKTSGFMSKMKGKGNFTYSGQKTNLNFALSKANALYENAKSDLDLKLKNNLMSIEFDGFVDNLQKSPIAEGDFEFDSNNLAGLMSWAGGTPNTGFPFQKASRKGKIQYKNQILTANAMRIQLDESTGNGSGKINFAGNKPKANITMTFDKMTLDRFMGDTKNAALSVPAANDNLPQNPDYQRTAATIDPKDLVIDLSGLNALNADYKIAINQTTLKGENTGKSDITGTLYNGVLKTKLVQSNFFKGKAVINSVVQNLGNSGRYNVDWNLSNIDINPPLRIFADSKKLEGTANSSGKLTMTGKTERQIRQTMNGNGNFIVRDGAIRGLNLGALSRDVTKIFASPSEKTEFAELSATYVAQNGRFNTNDLQMLAPIMRVTGNGYVDMAREYVDMKIVPKLVGTTKGQGGILDRAGIPIPFRAVGPFGNIKYVPDLGAVLKDKIKSPLDALKGKGGGGTAPADGGGTKLPDPVDTLKGLFGR